MAITGDNEYNIRDIPVSDYCWGDDPDPVDLDAVVRLYLIVSCLLGLIGVAGLAVLYLVL
jgi:hypothetical protein